MKWTCSPVLIWWMVVQCPPTALSSVGSGCFVLSSVGLGSALASLRVTSVLLALMSGMMVSLF